MLPHELLLRLARHYVWADNPKELRWPILHLVAAALWCAWGGYMVLVAFRSKGWMVPGLAEIAISAVGFARVLRADAKGPKS